MTTFSFDESTGFENYEQKKDLEKNEINPTFVAGLVYSDNLGDANERKRITAYLKAICDSQGICFPEDLHISNKSNKYKDDKDNINNNHHQVSLAKVKIETTFQEFFTYGTFEGNPLQDIDTGIEIPKREGNYKIFAITKKWNKKEADKEQKEFYSKIVDKAILKMVFLNDSINNGERVIFNIPTRVASDNDLTEKQKEEYRAKGFTTSTGGRRWYITGAGDSRRVIEKYIDQFPSRIMRLLPEGSSIFTDSMANGYEDSSKANQFAFMFLSDIVCSYLKHDIYSEAYNTFYRKKYADIVKLIEDNFELINNKADKELLKKLKNEIYRKTNNLSYKQFISANIIPSTKRVNTEDAKNILKKIKRIWPDKFDMEEAFCKVMRSKMHSLCKNSVQSEFYYFDLIDDYYDNAAMAAYNNQVIEALDHLYTGKHLNGVDPIIKNYYSKRWFNHCEKSLKDKMMPDALIKAINEAREYRETDNLDQNKLLYYYEFLCKLPALNELRKDQQFRLYDLGISAYTHIGDTAKAEECFNQCMELKDSVEDSEVTSACNRMITLYNDKLQFDEAIKYAISVIPKDQSKLSEEKKNLLYNIPGIRKFADFFSSLIRQDKGKSNELELLVPPTLRKTSFKVWGTLGQAYAFAGKEEAENCLIKIMDVLKDENKANYIIDLTYLLHYYIDISNKDKFEEYANDFYGGNQDLGKQLEYIIKKSLEPNNGYSLGYALFVFIKAFYYFYKDSPENHDILIRIINLEKTVKQVMGEEAWDASMMKGHPYELIYKYAALLALEDNNNKLADKNRFNISESVKDVSMLIVKRVMDYGDIEYRMKKSEMNPADKRLKQTYERAVNKLWNTLEEEKYLTESEIEKETTEEKLEVLKKKFTYMYH